MKTIFKSVLLTLAIGLFFNACGGAAKPAQENNTTIDTSTSTTEVVPYEKAKNYFVNNSYKKTGLKTITDQATFDTVFGMVATMGEDGKPTPIDFDNNYVIAIIGETSNLQPELVVNEVNKSGEKILVSYSLIEKDETSYTMQPAAILIVDKKYSGKVELADL